MARNLTRSVVFSVSAMLFGIEVLAGGWQHDYQAALKEAIQGQKPLLIHFSADWCGPCRKVKSEVLYSRDVEELLSTHLVGFYADFDANQQLAEQYNVQKIPSDVVVDPTTGRVISQSQGPHTLNSFLAMARQSHQVMEQRMSARVPVPIDDGNIPSGLSPSNLTLNLGPKKMLLGLDGFSPVALERSREWKKGSETFRYEHRGITYLLQNEEERETFRTSPDEFSPRLMGCDPVVLSESDRGVVGSTQFGAFYNDELYLFVSKETRTRFKANPEKFFRLQHAMQIDEIDTSAIR